MERGALGRGNEFEAFVEKGYLVVGDADVGEVDGAIVVDCAAVETEKCFTAFVGFCVFETSVVSMSW